MIREIIKGLYSNNVIWNYLELLFVQILFFVLYRYFKTNALIIPLFILSVLFVSYLAFWLMLAKGKWLRIGLSYSKFKIVFSPVRINYFLFLLLAPALPIVFLFLFSRIIFYKENKFLSFWRELFIGIFVSLVLGLVIALLSNHLSRNIVIEDQLGVTGKYMWSSLVDAKDVFTIKLENDKNYFQNKECQISSLDKYKCHIKILSKHYAEFTPTLIGIILSQASNAMVIYNLKNHKEGDYRFAPAINLVENQLNLIELLPYRSDLISQNIRLSFFSPLSSLELGVLNIIDLFIESLYVKWTITNASQIVKRLRENLDLNPLYKERILELKKKIDNFK